MKMKGFLAILLAALTLLCGCVNKPDTPKPAAAPGSTQQAAGDGSYLIAKPASHEYAADPDSIVDEHGSADYEKYDRMLTAWRAESEARTKAAENEPDLRTLTDGLLKQLMKDSKGENVVFSPMNIFMALAMLAETTDGQTRAELLKALGVQDMEGLRKAAGAILAAEPGDDGVSKCLIADSLWMNKGYSFNTDLLERLASDYEASSYWGDPADGGFVQALRDWLNENTGGLLKDAVDAIELDPETVIAIASTLYLKAVWNDKYYERATDRMTFHAPDGDVKLDFMHKTMHGNYYEQDGFTAVFDPLKNGTGNMWFLLPDEGVSIEDMLENGGMDFIFGEKDGQHSGATVNMSIPKMDVSSDVDLIKALKGMGVSSCFTPGTADFTPLTSDSDELYVSSIEHAARVKTDEDGVEAAAFTLAIAADGAMMPVEIVDFVLDRPFVFVITGRAAQPLFMGAVNVPNS